MGAWICAAIISLSSGRDESVLHHKRAKDIRKGRVLADQNKLLRIILKNSQYVVTNYSQECKSAAENQFR